VLGSNTPSRDALRSAECAQATFSGFLDVILRRASTLNATLLDKSNNPVEPQQFGKIQILNKVSDIKVHHE
jgi:hypothetical protein